MRNPALKDVTPDNINHVVQSLVPYIKDTLSGFVAAQSLSGQEMPAIHYMEAALKDLGLQPERIPLDTNALKDYPLFSPPCYPDDDRYSVLALHRPKQSKGKTLLFNGHLDVVPTGPLQFWDSPPFTPEIRDGWLYGRGAGDMKAGVVCALAAFKVLRELGVHPAAQVGFNGVLEEECTGNGALASVVAIQSAIEQAKATPFDMVIIPEPTGENLQRAQMGVFWLFIDVMGKPAHAAYMDTGVNPVYIAWEILEAVKELEKEWNLEEHRHPVFSHIDHPINFNLGQIHAGDWNSSVPSVCTIGLRLACYPGKTIEEAKTQVMTKIDDVRSRVNNPDVTVQVRHEGFNAPGCVLNIDNEPMQLLADTHKFITGEEPGYRSITGTTDARYFKKMLEIPVTCYGPMAQNVHGFNECVSIESMTRVTKVIANFMLRWCGVESID